LFLPTRFSFFDSWAIIRNPSDVRVFPRWRNSPWSVHSKLNSKILFPPSSRVGPIPTPPSSPPPPPKKLLSYQARSFRPSLRLVCLSAQIGLHFAAFICALFSFLDLSSLILTFSDRNPPRPRSDPALFRCSSFQLFLARCLLSIRSPQFAVHFSDVFLIRTFFSLFSTSRVITLARCLPHRIRPPLEISSVFPFPLPSSGLTSGFLLSFFQVQVVFFDFPPADRSNLLVQWPFFRPLCALGSTHLGVTDYCVVRVSPLFSRLLFLVSVLEGPTPPPSVFNFFLRTAQSAPVLRIPPSKNLFPSFSCSGCGGLPLSNPPPNLFSDPKG